MENLGLWEIGIIALVLFIKFGLIIGMMIWSKSNTEKKKRLFLADQQRKKTLAQKHDLEF